MVEGDNASQRQFVLFAVKISKDFRTPTPLDKAKGISDDNKALKADVHKTLSQFNSLFQTTTLSGKMPAPTGLKQSGEPTTAPPFDTLQTHGWSPRHFANLARASKLTVS